MQDVCLVPSRQQLFLLTNC